MAKCSSKGKELILKLFRDREKRSLVIKKTLGALWWVLIIGLSILMFSIIGAKMRGEVPKVFGHSVMKIVSGSMETEIPEGSYILIKEIDPAEVKEGDVITFRVSADGFLYNMVRIFTGTLIAVAEGRIASGDIVRITEAKDRSRAGNTATAHGLYLNRVVY